MELGRNSALPATALPFSQSKTAPNKTAPKGHASATDEKVGVLPGKAAITRRDYPHIVELKIAGRSDKEIARRMDVSVDRLKIHVAKAMAEYRRGELLIRNGEAVEEARKAGEDKGQQFASDIAQSPDDSAFTAEVALSTISVTI